MNHLVPALALILFTVNAVFQEETVGKPKWAYRFADFPAVRVYGGKPVPAKIVTRSDRHFKTRIREGASEGPNFAGHYTVVSWGCGSGCVSFVIVDAETGIVKWNTPFRILGIPFQGTELGREYMGLQYMKDSRLLIADGCPEDQKCGTYYFEWNQGIFRLKKFVADLPAVLPSTSHNRGHRRAGWPTDRNT